MKNIDLTGAEGNIGKRLMALGCESLSCDIRNPIEVEAEITQCKPDLIVHLAAQTNVEWCQSHYEEAIQNNMFGTNVVCQTAENLLGSGKVVVLSTDQVFNGKAGNYKEGDEQDPINCYGLTKFAAEGVAQLYDAKIIRISRCFDSYSKDIVCYLEEMKKGNVVQVPSHIFRSYTHFDFIAEAIYEYCQRFEEMPEILHIAGQYSLSFFDFMCLVAESNFLPTFSILPRGEEGNFTPRPAKGGLDVSLAKSLGLPIYSVYASIERMKNERT